MILPPVEAAKIALSDPSVNDMDVQVVHRGRNGAVRVLRTSYQRSCRECESGRPGRHDDAQEGCLGCLLLANEFARKARQTLDRAIGERGSQGQGARDDSQGIGHRRNQPGALRGCAVVRVFRRPGEYTSPFDAVARGACTGLLPRSSSTTMPSKATTGRRMRMSSAPLFKSGTEYPTPTDDPVSLMVRR